MFQVYLDTSRRSSRVMAHLLEPPGLGIRFESRPALDAGLGEAVAAHLAWLGSHGHWSHPTPDPAGLQWQIMEEQLLEGDFESGDDVGFYGPDLVPPEPGEIERYLAIARSAREELLALVRGLPAGAMEWRRDERSRPIGQILKHVAGAELWYITRVIDDPSERGLPPELEDLDRRMDATEDPVARLVLVRQGFEAFFRWLPLERLGRVVTPSWFCEITTERWTVRKALRRAIEHEREHTRSVARVVEGRG
ncbi:DinB family protein [Limnochorda pilosa]|uniref:DinB-like domain-containing protein n=1 Tax=Limnochorda pilosa TaxID=1555112 RepID=A0A0K2SL76_LIMPI|nr:DinB family protein [Limnochorda pilosa]BAS27868.1 hypothetical protein LIP_2027 [Limnochorda pilosa]